MRTIEAFMKRFSAREVSGTRALERQDPTRPNSFEAFVLSRKRDLEAYNGVSRTLRTTESVWRDKFPSVFEEEVNNNLRGQGAKLRGSGFERYRQETYELVFGGMQHTEECLEVAPDKWEDGIESGPEGLLHDFSAAYTRKVIPLRDKLNDKHSVIFIDMVDRLTTDYQILIDMHAYLLGLQDGPQKELVSAFFRDLAKAERRQMDEKMPSYLSPIREHWQKAASAGFSPVMQERFWISVQESPSFKLLRFGALAVINARGESRVVELSDEELMRGLKKIPMEKWPPMFREEYVKFGISDPAMLVDKIRNRLLELYPREQNNSYFKSPGTNDGESESSKRTKNGVAVGSSVPAEPLAKAEKKERELELAVLVGDSRPNTRDTHQVKNIDAEQVDQTISALAEVGNTPEMQQDLAEIIRQLRNPNIATAKYVVKLHKNIRVNGRTLPLRRLDPRDISYLRFQDPKTVGARVTFALSNETLYIDGVFPTHKEYERRIS